MPASGSAKVQERDPNRGLYVCLFAVAPIPLCLAPVEEENDPTLEYCRTFTNTMDEYLDFVSAVTEGDQVSIDAPAWQQLDKQLEGMSPSGLARIGLKTTATTCQCATR